MADDGRLRRLRITIATLGTLAAILVLATAWVMFRPGGPLVQQSQPAVDIGGPFELVTHKGDELSDQDLAGQPFAVFFGFTHCPEICPTTLWEMSEALKQLGPDAEKLRVLFISVDPNRDTPEFLSRYLQSFDPRIVGLTGSEEEIAAVGKVRWPRFPRQGHKVDFPMKRTIQHEDTQTVYGRVQGQGRA